MLMLVLAARVGAAGRSAGEGLAAHIRHQEGARALLGRGSLLLAASLRPGEERALAAAGAVLTVRALGSGLYLSRAVVRGVPAGGSDAVGASVSVVFRVAGGQDSLRMVPVAGWPEGW